MWARYFELILAIWLALSSSSAIDYICAFLVGLFVLLSFWYPLKKIHLLTLGVALWLWGSSYSSFPEMASPSQENAVVVGLLLLMLAIVPSHSHQLSPSWQKFIDMR